MVLSNRKSLAGIMMAALTATAVSGCSGIPEVLPQALGQTSYADALAARRDERSQVVPDSSLHEPGTLTVGLTTDQSAPLMLTDKDGNPTGVSVDVAYALADQLGIDNVKFVEAASADKAFAAGADVVMGQTQYATGSYAQSVVGIFGGSGAATAEQLTGAKIGIQAGSVAQRELSHYDFAHTESNYTTLNDAFSALSAGDIDFVACDAYAGGYLAAVYSNVSFAGALTDPVPVGVSTAADPELSSAIQAALDSISTNGVLQIARARWVGDLPTITNEMRVSGLATK